MQSEIRAFTLFREIQNEKKMLSLFFEKCKVKIKCFHSFSRSEKWNRNASRLRSRSENFWEFFNGSRETRFFNKIILWKPKKHSYNKWLTLSTTAAMISIVIIKQFELLKKQHPWIWFETTWTWARVWLLSTLVTN